MSEQIDITPEGSVVPVYLVELSEEEVFYREELALLEVERQNANEAREQAKQSALAKLALLGLTEEEAKAVIGL